MYNNQDMISQYYDGNLDQLIYKKHKSVSIEIDFTGQDLYLISKACMELDVTFSEFFNMVIDNFIEEYKEKQIDF